MHIYGKYYPVLHIVNDGLIMGPFKTVFAAVLASALMSVCSFAENNTGTEEEHHISFPVNSKQHVLRYAASAEIGSLDPTLVNDSETAIIVGNIYEGLMNLKPGAYDIEPGLAESYTISDDLLTYTFRLRNNVLFHDGTPFNADAVKFNFDRQLKDKRTPAMANSAEVFDVVEKVEVVDDLTVRIQLKAPQSAFIYNMSRTLSAPIASPAAIKKYNGDLSKHPVGTGAYRFEEIQDNGTVILSAFDKYYGPKPEISRVEVYPMLSEWSRVFGLLNGELDLIGHVTDISKSDIVKAGGMIHENQGNNINYMIFNMRDSSHTKSLSVRKAVAHAINIPELVSYLYRTTSVPAYTFVAVVNNIFKTEIKRPSYNPQFAAKLFAENNVDKLRIIVYDATRIYNSVGGALLADAVSTYLKEADVDVSVEVLPRSAYWKRMYQNDWDIAFTGWVGDTVDPTNLLLPLVSVSPDINRGLWINEDLHKAFNAAQLSTDKVVQLKHILQAERIIASELGVLPISHAKNILASAPELYGNFIHPLGQIMFSQIRICSENCTKPKK